MVFLFMCYIYLWQIKFIYCCVQEPEDPKKDLTELIRAKGLEFGLSAVSFTKLEKSECGTAYEDWVAKGAFNIVFF